MQSISHDSEWMKQYIAAVSIPNSHRFVCVHDANGAMMLFSLGTNDKLYVSAIDPAGSRVVQDLGQQVGFPSSYKASAFDVVQDVGSKLYIAMAIQKPSDASKSYLYLLRPIDVKNVDFSSRALNLQPYVMNGSGEDSPKVMKIFMVRAFSIVLLHLSVHSSKGNNQNLSIISCRLLQSVKTTVLWYFPSAMSFTMVRISRPRQ
jgi:hypothetical protein